METKIFVIEMPTVTSILDKVTDLFDKVIPKVSTKTCCCPYHCFDLDDEDFEDDDFENEISQETFGTPYDPNKRFGYGLEVDEPRRSDYTSQREFEHDHKLFDNFVDAGEACVERGLDKRNNAPITKCNAIRTNVGDMPPMDIDIIGETDWWNEDDVDFGW